MHRNARITILWMTALALASIVSRAAQAETIIKLGLGTDSDPDIQYDGTYLSTLPDNDIPPTPGDQNTRVDYQGFLSGMPDINTPIASFTLANVEPDGDPDAPGGFVVFQNFKNGSLFLYDENNDLLLSGDLDKSLLAGPLDSTATGALFTTTFGTVTGGSLMPLIDPNSLTVSISMTGVNHDDGFSLIHIDNRTLLADFTADVTLNIAAFEVPEPGSIALVMLGLLTVAGTAVQRPSGR
jgi:hypothetical protein